MSSRFPGQRFSFLRLSIVLGVIAALVVGGFIAVSYQFQSMRELSAPWTGGYVDATETPSFEFESRDASGQRNVILSFIVAKDDGCEPSWGNYYTLEEADRDLDLGRRIAQTVQSGREVVISYGGRDNEDLAATCTDVDSLADAMRAPLDRYGIDTIDLDIEGTDLTDVAGRERRAAAVAQLQKEARDAGESLAVWVTLPADRGGLTHDGLAVVESFTDAGAELSGVNLMTMNFGVSDSEMSTAALTEASLRAAHGQLYRMILSSGRIITPAQAWTLLGATPMIGQNDEPNEVFTIQDAIELHRFAQESNLGRLSFWSLNRDRECDSNYTDWQVAVNFCSGVPQDLLEFDGILSSDREGSAHQFLDGKPVRNPGIWGSDDDEDTADDQDTSPYPIWSAKLTYTPGDRVVWKRNVYAALWPSRGDEPTRVSSGEASAWRLIGPVLPGESPQELPTVPEGTYPQWNGQEVYDAGDRVLFDGGAYEAKWWTEGESPAAASQTDESPWRPLTKEEILEALNN